MILEQESQLLAQIKENQLAPIYLLYGEEQYLKEFYAKKLQEAAVGDAFPEFNFHNFDGNKLDMEQVAAAVESMPFMAEQRCVTITPFPYGSLNSKEKEIFDSLVESPVPTTVLILLVNDPEFLPKKNPKAKKLIAQIDHVGVVMELNNTVFIHTGCTVLPEMYSTSRPGVVYKYIGTQFLGCFIYPDMRCISNFALFAIDRISFRVFFCHREPYTSAS